jgi:hypothetical protein
VSILWAVDLVIAAAVAALCVHWVVERRRLRRFVAAQELSSENLIDCALSVASLISNRVRQPDDPPFLSPLLQSLGGTPSALIHRGGCCSGTSRLYILFLHALGIRANQITVYHRSGNAQHCLVEIHVPGATLIADPVYGVYYTDPAGRALSLEDLQAGASVVYRLIPGTTRTGYPDNDYYNFNFSLTKTANWTISWERRSAYLMLSRLTGGGIDRLRLPAILEWPQTLLIFLLLSATLLMHAGWIAIQLVYLA